MSMMSPRLDFSPAVLVIREQCPAATAIWLFGSSVNGKLHDDSDIDLAVLAPRPLDDLIRFELQRSLSVLLDRDVDLVDLASADTVLRCEVTTRGELIWTADENEALWFSARVLGEYAHWRDMTAALRAKISEDGTAVAQ